jgi:transposase
MWTAKNRRRYDRSNLRYPSDLTGDEWGHIEPLIPPAKRGSNERHVDVREVMNGRSKLCKQRLRRGMYILSTGCQWRAIPKDLPPRSTLLLSRLVELGRHAGSHPTRTLCGVSGARRTGSQPHRGHHRQPKRERRGKRGACIDPHGYDAGKKIYGKKRHILVDRLGLRDCRTHHCVAQLLPKARQGLGEPQSQGAGFPAPRLNPPHASKTL